MEIGFALVLAVIALILAFMAEGMTEYFVGNWFSQIEKLKPWKWTLIYVSALVGVGMAFYWHIDLIAMAATIISNLSGTEIEWPVSNGGIFLSGLAIGRGANYLHDFYKMIVSPKIPPE